MWSEHHPTDPALPSLPEISLGHHPSREDCQLLEHEQWRYLLLFHNKTFRIQ
jgi:hypothetical protein